MNAGANYAKALELAAANARRDGQPRFVWRWGGDYWVEKTPPDSAHVGDYDIVTRKPKEIPGR